MQWNGDIRYCFRKSVFDATYHADHRQRCVSITQEDIQFPIELFDLHPLRSHTKANFLHVRPRPCIVPRVVRCLPTFFCKTRRMSPTLPHRLLYLNAFCATKHEIVARRFIERSSNPRMFISQVWRLPWLLRRAFWFVFDSKHRWLRLSFSRFCLWLPLLFAITFQRNT